MILELFDAGGKAKEIERANMTSIKFAGCPQNILSHFSAHCILVMNFWKKQTCQSNNGIKSNRLFLILLTKTQTWSLSHQKLWSLYQRCFHWDNLPYFDQHKSKSKQFESLQVHVYSMGDSFTSIFTPCLLFFLILRTIRFIFLKVEKVSLIFFMIMIPACTQLLTNNSSLRLKYYYPSR